MGLGGIMQLNINLWILQTLLVGLRAFGVVDWSWVLVFLPILIPVFLVAGLIAIVLFIMILIALFAILSSIFDSVRK